MAFGQYLGYIVGAVGAIVGGVVGFYSGGPAGAAYGASLGFSIGGMVGGVAGQVFWPEKTNLNFAPPPQPHETRLQISSWGAPIPIQYGSGRLAGNIIYMSDIIETIERSRHRQDGVRYYEMTKTYTATFAIAFCDGSVPPEGIARIWMNNKIIADFRDPELYPGGYEGLQSVNLETTIARSLVYFTIYYGSESQSCDPALSALLTAAETPAYRGICLIVFIDFPVGEFSGVPTIEIETGSIGHDVWVERRPIDDNDYQWMFTASDGDGSTLLAGKGSSAPGYLYVSTNYGLTWSQVGVPKIWQAGCLNRTGQYGMAVDYTRLYVTTNYGATWIEARPVGDVDRAWCDTAVSADGSIMIVIANNQRAYRYSGVWAEVQPLGNVNAAWWRCAMSADGTVIILALATTSVYISVNSGASWTERKPTGGGTGVVWGGLDCSNDGSIIIITMDNGRVYVSLDYGATWAEKRPAGNTNKYWKGAACSASGSRMSTTDTNTLYISTDYGETWTTSTPGVSEVLGWTDMDDTGMNLIIASAKTFSGRVWTYRS